MSERIHKKTNIAKQIEVAALIANVELRELHKLLGISRQSFRLRRIGLRRWQLGELERIAIRLGVTAAFLEGDVP